MPRSPAVDTPLLHYARLLAEGDHRALSLLLLDALDGLANHDCDGGDEESLARLDRLFLALAHVLATPEFVISDRDLALRWIFHARTIASLAAASSFGSTDAVLRIVLAQPDNLVKVLALYSCANSQAIDIGPVFDSNPDLASLWRLSILGGDYASLTVGRSADAVADHLAALDDPRMLGVPGLLVRPFFFVTYAAPPVEAKVKAAVNRLIRPMAVQAMTDLPPRPRPDPDHVAVISSLWASDHAVYRTNARFVASLAGRFKLTLVTSANPGIETVGFDRVIRLDPQQGLTPLADLDAMTAFFPDVGMGEDSILLANCRLARIQIMSCGHPVSTFGSEMDYFLSGDEVDNDDTARRFYSERLLLIPGRGVEANTIPRPRQFVDKAEDGPLRIALPWSMPKLNRRTLDSLRRIADASPRPVEFHLFAGAGMNGLALPILRKGLEAILGPGRTVLYPFLTQDAYWEILASMHLVADSFPFGGFNTVVDALHFGVPMVVFEGERAFSRYGAHLMRGLGLGELVVTDHDAYVALLLNLAANGSLRRQWEERIRAIDLDAAIQAEDNARHFRTAVEYLIAHHDDTRSDQWRPPIRIGR
ncbi:hypothetical protein A6A04_12210 [Paramagnetospirillum marisnigri]|uniref:O-GlcNAc transferase C-terminal domain-containing protein n=1 Tax=Paramagnetospirillum marisnigri TaxID=1285242 RepID=A0A178MW25_9PROT|nr:hypothetical protein [Paramagnetospirillum marisnigri]OAN54681.1 hypothetical protein A6A04_12210 [Paramagnetospirillum marisnigri]